MITSINETTVWADSLEDQCLDVSIIRLLTEYNYMCPCIVTMDLKPNNFYMVLNDFGGIISFEKQAGDGVTYVCDEYNGQVSNGFYGMGDGYGNLEEIDPPPDVLAIIRDIQDGFGDSNRFDDDDF